jgi:hypothetical protein
VGVAFATGVEPSPAKNGRRLRGLVCMCAGDGDVAGGVLAGGVAGVTRWAPRRRGRRTHYSLVIAGPAPTVPRGQLVPLVWLGHV